MLEEEFSLRLAKLRTQKGVSARDMSLSLGQNPGYINSIENGKALPSMSLFFYICDYLEVTPASFFEMENTSPVKIQQLTKKMQRLPSDQLNHIEAIVDDLLTR